jgi:hypothetical protein
METTVVKFRETPGWSEGNGTDVYIGRDVADPNGRGRYGNPYALNPRITGHRQIVIDQYEKWLLQPERRLFVMQQVKGNLVGRRLGCFCAPEACHGDILKRVANEKEQATENRRQELGLTQ